jgi:hypothetical protein
LNIEELAAAAKLVCHDISPLHKCFKYELGASAHPWPKLKPDCPISFRGLHFVKEYMIEAWGIEPFCSAGDKPYLKFKCSREVHERFTSELSAPEGSIFPPPVWGISVNIDPGGLRAFDIGTEENIEPKYIDPNTLDWVYAQYEVTLLYGSNPEKLPNSVAILSMRVVPALDIYGKWIL